jgi:precorrin-2 dehydrogenase/sirohydrochlorin ferrochelatase
MENHHRSYYPVFLDLYNKKVVVVGGGSIAERKVMSLLDTGAYIIVISPGLTEQLRTLREQGSIVHYEKSYDTADDLKDAFVVIAATSQEDVNAHVARDTQGLINVVDTPHLCNFIVPSVIKRKPLSIAISTDGISPAFSRTLRQELEQHFGEEIAQYLIFVKQLRIRAKKEIKDTKRRERFLKEIASSEMLSLLRKKGVNSACHRAEELYSTYHNTIEPLTF